MWEPVRHALGLCGEPHGLLYLLVTGGTFILALPVMIVKILIEKFNDTYEWRK